MSSDCASDATRLVCAGAGTGAAVVVVVADWRGAAAILFERLRSCTCGVGSAPSSDAEMWSRFPCIFFVLHS